MTSPGTGTSFRQYQLCSLCKINHTNNKKHIYSKRHQNILKSIVTKFSDKIKSVRKDLFNPKVNNCTFENGAKFWCYFCKEENNKHELFENCTVIGWGLLEHITSTEHRSNMEQFFWDNLLKKDLKPKFILPLEDFHIFKKAAFLAVKKWQKAELNSRKMVAESIAMADQNRLVNHYNLCRATPFGGCKYWPLFRGCYYTEVKFKSESANRTTSEDREAGTSLTDVTGSSQSRLGPGTSWSGTNRSTVPNTTGLRTVSAKGEGLTCVLKQNKDTSVEGNVHTGGLPPWLQPDTDTSQRQEIGPTMEDYQKHVERLKKAKLPAHRVGAQFDHTADTSHDWLPSFGRVWSKGRRLQSKQHFERNWKKGEKSNMFSGKSNAHDPSRSSNRSSGRTATATFHENNSSHSDWSDSHGTANQDSSLSTDWNLDSPHSSSIDNSSTNQVVPYRRKNPQTTNRVAPYKRKNNPTDVTAPVIGGQFPTHLMNESGHQLNPYKRKRNSEGPVTLIQTPVLASSMFK